MNQESPVDMTAFIYGCVKSACRKDKVDFPYTLDEFMDSVDVETILSWSDELSRLTENAGAADVALSAKEVAAIDKALDGMEMSPVFGGSKIVSK